jgi:glucose/arabinose dehydrogenase
MRNPVGLKFRPGTNELWASVIERDFMGDKLPPDFVTRVKEGQFYGWPWFYIGSNRDPKHANEKPPRTDVTVPDILVEAHSTPIGLCFYDGAMFPAEYRGDMFLAMRGSTNVVPRTGYKVVRVDFRDGRADPRYEDFVVGWVPDRSQPDVYGRPAAVAVAKDGSLLIADEPGHTIWRVARAKV